MAKKVPIKYTSRDFNSIKADLVEYAKRYYPDTVTDFSQASFASLMLDSVSYVGDILSFYLDYQVNESFLDTAIENENIYRIARQMGYKINRRPVAYGQVTLYVLVPATTDGLSIDTAYVPILSKGSTFASTSGQSYTLVEDVDFSQSNNEIIVARTDVNTGIPLYYAVKAHGTVVSGRTVSENVVISSFEKFKKIKLKEENIVEIISVIDSEGREYYEVETLSQDSVMKEIKNLGNNTDEPTSIMKMVSVPRRFVVENEIRDTYLQFGYGSDDTIEDNVLIDPAQSIIQLHARDYISDSYFDPSDINKTDKFGIGPANTTLRIIYRVTSESDSNAAPASINQKISTILRFKDQSALSPTVVSVIRNSIEVTNEQPIVGDLTNINTSAEELKVRINNFYASQGRAVTIQDYTTLVYSMPARFGAVKRCAVLQDNNSFKRNINIYVISQDSNSRLVQANSVIKQNLKTYLSNYKMINDTVDILDAKIINFSIDFEVIGSSEFSKAQILSNCLIAIADKYNNKLDIGEHLSINELYALLNRVNGVSDVISVEMRLKNGSGYSSTFLNFAKQTSPDGRFIRCPKNAIFELRNPAADIKGIIR
ncbi:MAG: hypothetical protein RIR47_127 [Bacteroidota bacterium]|jgi:hypothetical protein